MLDRLRRYKAKRNFARTKEPLGERRKSGKKLSYLIQKHAARRLHYDFRLEWNGTLLSWAVPKGPSENPNNKRLAVHVEDHPVEYGDFEGTIPKGEYGSGTVMLWDRGWWEPHTDPDAGIKSGKLSFELHGERLKGNWALVRLRSRGKKDKGDNWLLIKEKDDLVRTTGKLTVDRESTSVKSRRTMEQIAEGKKVWRSNRRKKDSSEPAAQKTSAKLPPFVAPQLATLVDAPPSGSEWLHEIKFDGYRAMTSVAGDNVVVRTRNGLDWTEKFHALSGPLANLRCASALLDGEITVSDAHGRSDFGALQDAISEGKSRFGYYIFDLLHLDGKDLRSLPLVERKQKLKSLLQGGSKRGPLFFSDHLKGDGQAIFSNACKLKLEGIISKRVSDRYRSGRAKSWLKIKCGMEQEFVIIGWRPSDKAGRPFSSLLLALRENSKLRYAGRVGTGYSAEGLDRLSALFKKHARRDPPVDGVPGTIARHAHFVEPILVAEIAFRGWTRDGLVRQGSFKGLREDKPAREVFREKPMPKSKATKAAETEIDEIEGVRITHPDRVLFSEHGVTKRELIDYYVKIADLILPHIVGRPLSLVRCPRGSGKECFFQKHASPGWPDLFKKIRIKEKSGSDEYLYIEDIAGVVAAAQMGVLELHIWGSHVDQVEKPDRLVFDLDPDEGLNFGKVKDGAQELRERLLKLGLESFAMATGGKGIHVVVPLLRKHGWDEHRAFAEAMARIMAEDNPDDYVANMSKAKRRGKIFIDYLRNQRGSTAIAPYSTRARKGAYVAVPISWRTMVKLSNAHPASVEDVVQLKRAPDPWDGYAKVKQTLPKPSQLK